MQAEKDRIIYLDKLRLIKQNALSKLNSEIHTDGINNVMSDFVYKVIALQSSFSHSLPLPVDDSQITEEIEQFYLAFKKKMAYLVKPDPLRPSKLGRSYDQVVKGDIKIVEVKNNTEYSHKITFHKIGKFLQYQTFDPKGTVQITHLARHPDTEDHPRDFNKATTYIKENPDKVVTVNYEINDDRDVMIKNGKEWVLYFNSLLNFTPTTVMEIGYKKYIFVIKKTEINTNNKVVFYISTKEIHVDNKFEKMKKLKKIHKGEHKNVRFDIDYGQSTTACDVQAGYNTTCYCPANSVVTTRGVNWIQFCEYNSCYDGGTDCLGICWHHTSYWPYWPYGPYSRSHLWDTIPGYFCNPGGVYGPVDTSPQPNCPGLADNPMFPDELVYPACWNSSDNKSYCCIPNMTVKTVLEDPFYYTCCPPGSSC